MREVDGEEPREHAGAGHRHGPHASARRRHRARARLLPRRARLRDHGPLPSAAFVSAGGYHHHLGFNIWLGHDVKPLPPNTAGLRHWTVLLTRRPTRSPTARARVEDAGLATQPTTSGFLVRDPLGDRGRVQVG